MTAVVYSSARFSAQDTSGGPLGGGKLFTYQNGTTVPATTYSDSAGTVNANPIVLNERGEAVVYVDPMQVYTFVLRDGENELIWSQDGVTGAASSVDFSAFKTGLADGLGDPFGYFKQPETGAVTRQTIIKNRERQTSADYDTLQHTADAKRGGASSFDILPQQTSLAGILNLGGYLDVRGAGDASQVKLATGGGLRYQNSAGVFDDHPHKTVRDFRITGDGTFVAYPGAQNGTTTGYGNTFPAHGSFGSYQGMTYELNAVGHALDRSYSNYGMRNHYRANKVGLKLDRITNYFDLGSYFRYNSDAAILLSGDSSFSVMLIGTTLEGNPGSAIKTESMNSATVSTLTMLDVYTESNGNNLTVPTIDIPDVRNFTVKIVSGSYGFNIASGVTSGFYRWGRSVTFDASELRGGYHYVDRIGFYSNTYIAGSINNTGLLADNLTIGLVEPALLQEWIVRGLNYSQAGQVFRVAVSGRPTKKNPITNLATMAYPHIISKSAAVTVTENTAIDYGDGSWSGIVFDTTTGDFSNNFVLLQQFTDASSLTPYKIMTLLLKPEGDVTLGFVGSGVAPSLQNMAAYHLFKSGVTYRLILIMGRLAAGTTLLRMFPTQTSAPKVNILPVYSGMVGDEVTASGLIRHVALGIL